MVAGSKSALLLGAAAAIGLSEAFSPAPMALSHSRSAALTATPTLRAERSGLAAATMARESFVAGNWKCNPIDVNEARQLATAVVAEAKTAPGQVAIFVPHPYVAMVSDIAKGSNVEVGGQNMYVETQGAYTGATGATMLKSVGATHVLVGHSERRATFGATEELINGQVLKALDEGLKPLLCIGETKEEYESGLNTKIAKGLRGVTKEQMKHVTIAYEPVWAIGTGLVCDAAVAQDVHASIRSFLAEMFDKEVAGSVRIQYGGSVTPDSVDELMGKPDIDGCLVGGASLDASKFKRIMNYEPFKGKGATPFGGKPGGFREMMWKAMSKVDE